MTVNAVGIVLAFLCGVVGGALARVVARRRRPDAVDQALVDLVELATAAAGLDPVRQDLVRQRAHLIVGRVRVAGVDGMPEPSQPVVPTYVRRLFDAWRTGGLPDFRGCWVPPEVEGMLRAAAAAADGDGDGDQTVPLPATGGDPGPGTGPGGVSPAERDAQFDAAVDEAWRYVRGFGPASDGSDVADFRRGGTHVDEVNAQLRARTGGGEAIR